MFIRTGPYTPGIFHFDVTFSDEFPAQLPTIRFTTPVHHPFVGLDGSVNVSGAFNTRDVKITDAFEYLKVLFCMTEIPAGDVRVLNPAAQEQLAQDRGAFLRAAKDCGMASFRSPNVDGCAVRFGPTGAIHQELKEFISGTEWTAPEFRWDEYFDGLFKRHRQDKAQR